MDLPQDIQCCIAGGGPAGMMLGYLLARAGVQTLVFEKHVDFLRDFRGDTVHPSTLQIMYELGLLEDFLKLPHQKIRSIRIQFDDTDVPVADFTHLPTQCPFVALMPQWDLLDFIARKGEQYPAFHLMMQAEVTDLLEENGVVSGVQVKTPQGTRTVRSRLVIGADGRHSLVRQRAGLKSEDLGAPMDVVWFRLSRRSEDGEPPLGRLRSGKMLVTIPRDEQWQCGLVIPKGGFEALQKRGLESWRQEVSEMAPFLVERVQELQSWNQAKLLTVTVDHLLRWYRPGLLCIGDAAHAMSPIGGVGINLAIQDAVATANLLAQPLRQGAVALCDLARVQCRREWPMKLTQRMQLAIQNRVIGQVLKTHAQLSIPWIFKLLSRWPYLRRYSARVIGLGFRPEHPVVN